MAADTESKSFLRIVDGETTDLFPGRDNSVSTVERVRAMSRHVNGRVRESIRKNIPDNESYRVVVEFQMGPNAPSRTVSFALVTMFIEQDVIIIGPSLKNMVSVCPEGRKCFFAEKYVSSYSANKAHAMFNFMKLEEIFGTGIPPIQPASLRGHMADSFMQILGHIVHGAKENADQLY